MVYRYEFQNTLPSGEGCYANYFTGCTPGPLHPGTLMMYSHHDKIGNIHFLTCENNQTIAFTKAHAKLENLKRINND